MITKKTSIFRQTKAMEVEFVSIFVLDFSAKKLQKYLLQFLHTILSGSKTYNTKKTKTTHSDVMTYLNLNSWEAFSRRVGLIFILIYIHIYLKI